MTPAREVDASFFLEASAGTGKTTQLIDQIVRCVGAGTRLEGVVAVTFTHAAAGEMKLRLREELGKAGQSSADLELAFVGTIHAFCARLLRERPVEAGVDPRFVELDQENAGKLFAGVLNLSATVLLAAIGVSERSFARRKAAPKTRLPLDEGDRLWRFAEVLAHATRVFGSQGEAEQWLDRPAIGLDHGKPIDLLRTHPGTRLVSDYLTRIEHGVYV